MNTFLRSLLSAATILIFSLPCSASVNWSLNNFIFSDGGTAVGQFEWDETTNQVIAWDIDVLPALNGSPGTYSDATGTASAIFTGCCGGGPQWFLDFDEGLWNFRIGLAGFDLLDTPVPVLSLTDNLFVTPGGFIECDDCGMVRAATAGAFLSAAVPEPATLALLGPGLAGLGFARKRAAA